MRKIYLSIIAVLALLVTANAQKKNVDIEVVLLSPLVNATLPCNDSFLLSYTFVNHGPDALSAGDTISFKDPETEVDGSWYQVLDSVINVNDTFGGYSGMSHYQMTKSLLNVTNDTIYGAPFNNGSYNYYVELYLDTALYNDANLTNNIATNQVVLNCDLSANDLLKSTNLNVYPNPAKTTISFAFDFTTAQNATARVYDLMGRTLLTQDFGKQAAGLNNFTIDIATLSNGVYYIELSNGDSRGISKFTVSK